MAHVFFRAPSTRAAFQYLAGMAGLHGNSWMGSHFKGEIAYLILGLAVVWFAPNTQEILGQAGARIQSGKWVWLSWKPTWQWSLAVGVLFFVSILCIQNTSTFLYFQF